jgi:acyl carrier protein
MEQVCWANRLVAVGVMTAALCGGCDESPSTGPAQPPAPPPARAPATRAAAAPASPAAGNGSVEADVTRIIAELLKVPPARVTPEADLARDLKADELHKVELVMKLEEQFKLRIKDDEADRLRTVGQVIEYVRERKK